MNLNKKEEEYNLKTDIIPLVFICVLLLIFTCFNIYKLNTTKNKITKFNSTTAIVVEINKTKNKLNHTYSYPIFEYTVNNKSYKYNYFDSNYAYKVGSPYNINETMVIYYNPTNPNEVIVMKDIYECTLLIIISAFSILILILAIVIELKKIKTYTNDNKQMF